MFDPITKRALFRLNELEYVNRNHDSSDSLVDNGLIFANIWYKDEIIAIRPSDGVVVRRYDMKSLFPMPLRRQKNLVHKRVVDTPLVTNVVTGDLPMPETTTPDCLNGIAYNAEDDTFVLTGKWWPDYFHVKLNP